MKALGKIKQGSDTMDFMFLIWVILVTITVICVVGWIIASWVERDLFIGKWRGSFMGGWIVSAFAFIVIALIRHNGLM